MNIEQMSDEYVKSTLIGSESIKKNAFKAGANAVLKEIEDELNKQPLKFGRTWRSVYNKLNELK